MEIISVRVNNTADVVSVENGTAVHFRVCNTSDYHLTNMFVRIEQIEDTDFPLRDVSFSHEAWIRDLFACIIFTTPVPHYQ